MSGLAPLDQLSSSLARLPGVGRRSAERMALALVRDRGGLAANLITALEAAREAIGLCSRCGAVTARSADPCTLCVSTTRDGSLLCVVEDPGDILQIEKSGGYRGRYHALMGRLSPMKGQGPAQLRVKALIDRLDAEPIQEVILAMNTDVEGDATASYLGEQLRGRSIKISRLALGMPAGSGVAYSDAVTLSRALKGRWEA
ncbi:MAG: recombination mediator RecR [Verrucomicrobia bacterium]|nr:recombination mediator RecR [Verrucomicrobiota bacterium]